VAAARLSRIEKTYRETGGYPRILCLEGGQEGKDEGDIKKKSRNAAQTEVFKKLMFSPPLRLFVPLFSFRVKSYRAFLFQDSGRTYSPPTGVVGSV